MQSKDVIKYKPMTNIDSFALHAQTQQCNATYNHSSLHESVLKVVSLSNRGLLLVARHPG